MSFKMLSFCVLILILIVSSASAQVVIHPQDIPCRAGSVLAFWIASDAVNGIEVDVGPSGANRRWDMTLYQFPTVTYDTIVDPQGAPSREQFPTANRVLHSDLNELGLNLGSGYQYEVVSDSGWFMLGVQSEGLLGRNQPLVYPSPLLILPMPAEFEDSWEISLRYQIGFPAPDTLMGGLLDSVYIRIAIGGFSQIDGWGVIVYSGGELPVLRQRISTGGRVTVVGTYTLFGQRREIELPFGFDLDANQTYRWISPVMGEIARIVSMPGENNAEFNLASSVRVRRVVPEISFPPPLLSFGVVHLGNSGMGSLEITNRGEGLASIYRVEFTGGLENEIEIISPLPFVIAPDSSARLRFLWTPLEEKSLAGNTVSLYHNDPQIENPKIFSLQGATPEFATVEYPLPVIPLIPILTPPYPNPFNKFAYLEFSMPSEVEVVIKIVDICGRVVQAKNYKCQAGRNIFRIDADSFPDGLYQVQLVNSDKVLTQSLVLVK